MRVLWLAFVLALCAPSLLAQGGFDWSSGERGEPSPFFLGVHAGVVIPRGEFSSRVDPSFGLAGHVIYGMDPAGVIGLRFDGGYSTYGRERFLTPLSSAIGGRILVDVVTSNSVSFLEVGPHLMAPVGRVRPYLNTAIGVGYFSTTSSIRPLDDWRGDDRTFSTRQHSDFALALGGGAGMFIPVRPGPLPVFIDLGARYHDFGEAEYLREGSIRDHADGTISFTPIRSEVRMWMVYAGASFRLPK